MQHHLRVLSGVAPFASWHVVCRKCSERKRSLSGTLPERCGPARPVRRCRRRSSAEGSGDGAARPAR
eukprot:3769945-Lingulodinium_polyedra.AAC.1